MKKMSKLDWTAFVLVIVGALNWGLYAFGYNIVDMIFGNWPSIVKGVYVLIGLSALYMDYMMKKHK